MRTTLTLMLLTYCLLVSACGSLRPGEAPAPGVQSPLMDGNKVSLLIAGPQTIAAMETAIRSAQSSIHLETYIFANDAVGQRMATLLMERQRAGVKTRIIYDSVGTLRTPQAFFEELRGAGIELLAFNPINPLRLRGPWAPNNRDHRKILVVDGRIAFTGGINISEDYAASSLLRARPALASKPGWRDTHVQIEGPAVAVLQRIFLRTWNRAAEHPADEATLFPPLTAAGDKRVRVVASEPDGQQEIYSLYLQAIHAARTRIQLTCAYFVPDAQLLAAMVQAAQRGVEVSLVLPGVPEGALVFHAGRDLYATLLAGGVRIYLLRHSVLHAKSAVVDGYWSTVGSTNLDMRSFLHNSEINVVVLDAEFAATLEAAFAEDLKASDALDLPTWQQRPWSARFKEWLARQFTYWL